MPVKFEGIRQCRRGGCTHRPTRRANPKGPIAARAPTLSQATLAEALPLVCAEMGDRSEASRTHRCRKIASPAVRQRHGQVSTYPSPTLRRCECGGRPQRSGQRYWGSAAGARGSPKGERRAWLLGRLVSHLNEQGRRLHSADRRGAPRTNDPIPLRAETEQRP
jgi:hypothetical protein